jgi:hypothetical protein
MKVTTTRTLNPLPFQDLEPRRFEDLVRQLAYDLRRWKSLEATGRSGSDEGLDIRAIEIVVIDDDEDDVEEDNEGRSAPRVVGERLWIFQCKREKTLAQKRVREVVAESLVSLKTPPYGFVLAVACDVSKKTRDAFREEMVKRGIEEFALWAKGELEDMLFQPKNDRLLFAYFGISLATRRRSVSTAVRSTIARKKQLSNLLGEDEHHLGKLVLLRDPSDERYPREAKEGEPPSRWIACRALGLQAPGHLLVLRHEYLAATTPDGLKWDAILSYDAAARQVEGELRSKNAWGLDEHDRAEQSPHDFWNEYIADADRVWLKVYRFVPVERVIAIDPLGDGYYPVPHVFVEFVPGTGPFSDREFAALESTGMHGGRIDLRPEKANQVAIFPKELPGEDDPPLAGFDHTSSLQSSLSESVDLKFKELLAGIDAERKPPASPASDRTRLERAELKMRPFKEWRDKTALPLLSAFVSRLRAAGHSARVVVRSVGADAPGREAQESIELRVRVHIGTPHNPSYRPSGHVRVMLSEYGGWQLDLSPSRDDSSSRYSTAPRPKAESMPLEQLEAEVISMLERLKARGY